MIEEGDGAKAMSPGWWFDRAEGIGVGVVVSCIRHNTCARVQSGCCSGGAAGADPHVAVAEEGGGEEEDGCSRGGGRDGGIRDDVVG